MDITNTSYRCYDGPLPMLAEDIATLHSSSIIIAAHNAEGFLGLCLDSLAKTGFQGERIVVDDGSTDQTAAIARARGVNAMSLDRRSGPAHARNLGARQARGDLLIFVDADVCVRPDTLRLIFSRFEHDAKLSALFGSYDDDPAARTLVSQYRNLLHCFTHQTARREACTFWAGCGAIRRADFLELGGFDESIGHSSIEDIEFGFRMFKSGKKVALDPDIQVKHLKHWKLLPMLRTDILRRGVPWTKLILNSRFLPADIGLQWSQRISTILTAALPLTAIASAWEWEYASTEAALSAAGLGVLICAAVLAINRPFYRFLAARRGWWFTVRAAPLHLAFYLCCAVSAAIGGMSYLLADSSARRPASELDSSALEP